MEGLKYDKDKIRMELVPLSVVESIAKVLTYRAKKYTDNSWKELSDFWNRYKGALLRHLAAIDKGELIDEESGLPHIDQVLCNAVFLSWGYHNGKSISIEKKDANDDDNNDNENSLFSLVGNMTSRAVKETENRLIDEYRDKIVTSLIKEFNKVYSVEIQKIHIIKGNYDCFDLLIYDTRNIDLIYTKRYECFYRIGEDIRGSFEDLISSIKEAILKYNSNPNDE